MTKIKWVSESNSQYDPSERGYWRSACDRFEIWPGFRHTCYPSHYNIRDKVTRKETSYDRVRDCKDWAWQRIENELKAAFGPRIERKK